MSLTTEGIIFLVLANGTILSLLCVSFYKLLRKKDIKK